MSDCFLKSLVTFLIVEISLFYTPLSFSVQDDRDDISQPVREETISSINLSSKRPYKSFSCRINQAVLMLSKYLFGIILGELLVVYELSC